MRYSSVAGLYEAVKLERDVAGAGLTEAGYKTHRSFVRHGGRAAPYSGRSTPARAVRVQSVRPPHKATGGAA